MKRLILIAAGFAALVFAGSGSAALVPGVFDPDHTGCPVSTYHDGVLHLEKNCATSTNASAGADITGLNGQTFVSASFTLKSPSQCQGGSPRFNISTTTSGTGTFFLGCNNVTPVMNADGSATYTFNAATIAAGGQPFPTGTITGAEVLIDVQGTADLTHISVNGQEQVPARGNGHRCKHGGWKTFTSHHFKNQGRCVSFFNHENHKGHHDDHGDNHGKSHHDDD